ncbi:hypothetical protein EGW08_004385 [Elysia chlorotica]|uniref:Uncharacterized protein n=1 Tax=Elysia chlorotica TaxID=188477 RepID=A0A433U206_ELYCH|nr:hypothetical protein EGW08_004385 [Elysia chlorotica]
MASSGDKLVNQAWIVFLSVSLAWIGLYCTRSPGPQLDWKTNQTNTDLFGLYCLITIVGFLCKHINFFVVIKIIIKDGCPCANKCLLDFSRFLSLVSAVCYVADIAIILLLGNDHYDHLVPPKETKKIFYGNVIAFLDFALDSWSVYCLCCESKQFEDENIGGLTSI